MLKIHTILLFFLASCNKLPGIWQLKTTENISLTFLEARNPKTIARPKSGFQQSCASSSYTKGDLFLASSSFCLLPAFLGLWQCRSYLCLWSRCLSFFCLCQILLCFSLTVAFMVTFRVYVGFPGQSPHLRILGSVAAVYSQSQVLRIKMSIPWGHCSASHKCKL